MRSGAIVRGGGVVRLAATLACAGLLIGCGDSGKQDRAAYEACVAAAKAPGTKLANAKFESFENSKVTGSTGEEEVRVNIPYELGGQKATHQCIAQKQRDGSFKAVF